MQAVCEWASRHVIHTSSAHIHVPLPRGTLLTKHKFRDKITENFKMVTVEHQTKCEALLSIGTCVATQITHLRSQP